MINLRRGLHVHHDYPTDHARDSHVHILQLTWSDSIRYPLITAVPILDLFPFVVGYTVSLGLSGDLDLGVGGSLSVNLGSSPSTAVSALRHGVGNDYVVGTF